jgi:hypothetical protein
MALSGWQTLKPHIYHLTASHSALPSSIASCIKPLLSLFKNILSPILRSASACSSIFTLRSSLGLCITNLLFCVPLTLPFLYSLMVILIASVNCNQYKLAAESIDHQHSSLLRSDSGPTSSLCRSATGCFRY